MVSTVTEAGKERTSQADIIEEILGEEIVDETDREERKVLRLPSGELLVDPAVETLELARTLEMKLPSGRLGELVVQQLGRIPDEGEELEVSGLLVRVERATPQRIVQLRVAKP